MKPRIRFRQARTHRGGSIVEFALAFPLLFAFFSGTFMFGYSFYIYNKLVGSVRAGARYASQLPYSSGTTTPASDFTTAVRNMVVYQNPAGGTTPIVPGLQPSAVTVSADFVDARPDTIRVAINGYSINAIVKSFTLSGRPFSVIRYQGRISGP